MTRPTLVSRSFLAACALLLAGAAAAQASTYGAGGTASAVQYVGANQINFVPLGGPGERQVAGQASVFGAGVSVSGALNTATLRVTAAADAYDGPGSGIAYGAGGTARVWDRLFITADSDLSALSLPLQFFVHGTTTGPEHYLWASFEYLIKAPYGDLWSRFAPGGDDVENLSLRLPPRGETWIYDVSFSLSAAAYGGADGSATANYGNTAGLRWDLPRGVRVESASGVFAPAAITPVPEPAAAWLLLAGLALLGLRRRRAWTVPT